MNNTLPIAAFTGPYRWLSNFWPVPGGVDLDGVRYPTAEHAYQAAKIDKDDYTYRRYILCAPTPSEAKRRGRGMQPPDWYERSEGVMMGLEIQKYATPELREKLRSTNGRELIEGNNWHDTFWGVCNGRCRTPHAEPQGENRLGKLLMRVRAKLP